MSNFDKKAEHAAKAAEGKSKEVLHAAKKEENKAIVKDSNAAFGDRVAAAGGVISEKAQELAGKAQFEWNADKKSSDKCCDKAEAAKDACAGKCDEIKHSALKEGYKAQAKDSSEPISNRAAAAGHAASEKLSEVAAKTKHEANMEALRH